MDFSAALANIRARSKGNQHSVSLLLAAMDAALLESQTDRQPTAYLLAILATLAAHPAPPTVADALSLLALVIGHVPAPVLVQQRHALFDVLQFQALPPSRPVVAILDHLLAHLPPSALEDPRPRSLFRTLLLPLVADPATPKLRRQAHQALARLRADHPYAHELGQTVLAQLSAPALDTPTALALLALARSAHHLLAPTPTVHALLALLEQPHLGAHPYVSERLFALLEALVASLPAPLNVLLALIDRAPAHPHALVGWLAALEHAAVAAARKASSGDQLEQALALSHRLARLVALLGHEEAPVRNAARSLADTLVRVCISDQLIEKTVRQGCSNERQTCQNLLLQLISTFEDVIQKLEAWSAPTEELSNVLETLISRLRERFDGGPPAATLLLRHLLQSIALHRERTGMESVIGKMCAVCGPATVTDALPLDLLDEHPDQSDSHSWLLALLSRPGYVINTQLAHFVEIFVPLSEKLFERRREALEHKASSEAKTCETLVAQIWALLPGYCDLPRDLTTAFTPSFAELLAQVLYTQPSLRAPVLRALRNLADRNLSLSKPVPSTADAQHFRNFGISSFQAIKNVECLRTLGGNMVKVLVNLLSRRDEGDGSRSLVVECIRSWIPVLSDADFAQIATTITVALQAHSPTSVSTSEASLSKLETMLDTYALLIPRLSNSQALQLVSSDSLLCGPAQKKAYRILTAITVQSLDASKAEVLLERIIEIGQDSTRVTAGAKADRMGLVAGLVSRIGVARMDLVAGVIAEVILGCKESNKETRGRAYDLLIDMGKRMMEPGGKIDRRLIVHKGEVVDDDTEEMVVKTSVDEYLTVVSAGLAGKTPHMISATIMALSRILFEFHKDLKQDAVTGLLNLALVFLSDSKNREIIKSVVGFIKVAIVTLPQSTIEIQLEEIVKGLIRWANEHRNELKKNVRHLFERLVRKFGDVRISGYLRDDDEGGKKLINSIRKARNREKKKKEEARKKFGAEDEEMELDEQRIVGVKNALGDAYEQALYGSDMSEVEEEELNAKRSCIGGGKSRVIEEGEDEVADLLDPTRITKRVIAGKVVKVEQRRIALAAQGAKYKRDPKTGKMMITDDDSDEEGNNKKKSKKKPEDKNEALGHDEVETRVADSKMKANIYGHGGQTRRDEGSRVSIGEPRKVAGKRNREDLLEEEEDAEDEEEEESLMKELKGLEVTRAMSKESKKVKKVRTAKEKLGGEFKAKKAGGDMTKIRGISPYAYLPLSNVSGKNKNKFGKLKKIDITGKKRGSRN